MDENNTLKQAGLLILFTLVLTVAMFSGKKIYDGLTQYKENKEVYDGIKDEVLVIEEEKKEENKEEEKEELNKNKKVVLNVNYKKLKERNSDCIGWVYVPDTPINYPILQSHDDEYYLYHTLDGEWNIAGAIFTDKLNDKLNDEHTIIYGHNMYNGTMFASVNKYANQDFYDKHKFIYIGTEEGITEKYQIFSCYRTVNHVDPYKLNLTTKDITNMMKKSEVDCDSISIFGNFKIITLSTCTSRIKEERFVAHAVLVDSYK